MKPNDAPLNEKGISPDQELTPDTTNVTPNDNVIVGQSEPQGNDNTTSGAEVFPFGVDPLATSRLFMHEDLARSGLTVQDFPALGMPEPEPLLSIGGRACYKMHYTSTYYKLKIDRDVNKYVGLKGVAPPVVVIGKFRDAAITASVEGLKKAIKFYKDTGIPTLAIDSCWSFGETVDDAGEVKVKNLHNDIILNLYPEQAHVVLFDGDYATNDNVRTGLSTYKVLLEEYAVSPIIKSLPGRGYDDWSMDTWGATPPTANEVWKTVRQLPDVPPTELLGCPLSFAIGNRKRLSKSLLDHTDRGAGSLVVKLLGAENLKYVLDTDEWVQWDKESGKWIAHKTTPYSLIDVAAQHYFQRASVCEFKAGQMEGSATLADKAALLLAEAKACTKFARSHCSSTYGRGAVLRDLAGRHELHTNPNDFDADVNLLGVSNGVVDLRTGVVRPVQQADMLLRSCRASYTGVEPTGDGVDRIKQFLTEVLGDCEKGSDGKLRPSPNATRYDYFSRRLGAALFGYNPTTSFESWTGIGANGKTVLSKLLIAMLGESAEGGYAATVPADIMMSSYKARDAESSTPTMSSVRGSRLLFVTESSDTQHINEPLVKMLTGGDKLRARGNYKDAGSGMVVTFTPILLSNSLPKVARGDTAFWDRVSCFEFKNRWRRVNVVDATLPDADPWFEVDAAKDQNVLDWLLWWGVTSAAKFYVEGVGERPVEVAEALKAYQERENTFEHWAEDSEIVEAEGYWFNSQYLYSKFKDWHIGQGSMAPSQKVFLERLKEFFPHIEVKKLRVPRGTTSGSVAATGDHQQRVVVGLRFEEVQ